MVQNIKNIGLKLNSLYSINIERAVLSSILFDPSEYDEVMQILRPIDFYLPAHQKIFEAMGKLYNKHIPIDEEFLRKELNTKDVDDSVFIEILSTNSISNTAAYTREIKEESIKRALIGLTTIIKKSVIEENKSAYDSIEEIQSSLNTISDETIGKNKNKNIQEIVDDFMCHYKEAAKSNDLIGVKSGIKELDNIVGTFAPGDLVVIAARPSMGKTALATTITNNALDQNESVLFDSLEMYADKLIQRLIANKAEENLIDLKKGVSKNHTNFIKTVNYFSTNKNLILHDKSYVTINYLKAKALKYIREAKKENREIKHWFIDHLRYIKILGKEARHLEVGNITKELKAFAKEHGLVIYLLTQLNRDITGRRDFRPQLSDIRDSGSVEEDADIILFPHRDSYYKRADKDGYESPINDAEIIVAKNRDGKTGIAKCMFNGPLTKFGSSFVVYESEYECTNDKAMISMPIINMD